MKMYVVKDYYTMLSGFKTVIWRWWFKKGEEIIREPGQIQHSTEVNKARKKYINEMNKQGKTPEVYFKDKTK